MIPVNELTSAALKGEYVLINHAEFAIWLIVMYLVGILVATVLFSLGAERFKQFLRHNKLEEKYAAWKEERAKQRARWK